MAAAEPTFPALRPPPTRRSAHAPPVPNALIYASPGFLRHLLRNDTFRLPRRLSSATPPSFHLPPAPPMMPGERPLPPQPFCPRLRSCLPGLPASVSGSLSSRCLPRSAPSCFCPAAGRSLGHRLRRPSPPRPSPPRRQPGPYRFLRQGRPGFARWRRRWKPLGTPGPAKTPRTSGCSSGWPTTRRSWRG